MITSGGKNMRLDSRAANGSIGGSYRTVEDEDGGEKRIRDVVERQLLQRQVRQRGGHGRHGCARKERFEIRLNGKQDVKESSNDYKTNDERKRERMAVCSQSNP